MIYTCPMHPEVQQNKPGKCPKCGMRLVLQSEVVNRHHGTHEEPASFKPLFIIVGMILLVTIVTALRSWYMGDFSWTATMSHFMAGFFLVFSGFKFLDLSGFAEGYSTYDLLAQKVFSYGYVYPFIELGLGLLFLLQITSPWLNLFTFLLMSFSGLGVALKLMKHEKFQCACLGTFLKVPLTKVTLVEDFGMAAMALAMFLMK